MGSLDHTRPYALTALRVALGLVIFSFGAAKILHVYPGNYTPPVGSLSWIAGLIELVAGLLFLIGYQTRLAAFVLSGLMAAAYFISHFPKSFFPTENGGHAAAVFCFAFLYFVTAGGGHLSLDRALRTRTA